MSDLIKLDLPDIIPEESFITLDGKEYKLRPFSLKDEAWMGRTFGTEVESIFTEMRMVDICRIVYNQLEDKSDFKSYIKKDYNDDGDEIELKVKGYEALMEKVQGKQKQLDILNALLKTIGVSQPVLDDMEKKQLEDSKKKQTKKQSRKK